VNQKQKVVLLIGFLLVAATGLYPPWVQSWKFVAGGEEFVLSIPPGSEGYSFIFHPPGPPPWVGRNILLVGRDAPEGGEESAIPEAVRKLALKSANMSGPWRSRIDFTRLLAQWLVIAAGAFTGVAWFSERKWAPK
jgi:hypothetical protein